MSGRVVRPYLAVGLDADGEYTVTNWGDRPVGEYLTLIGDMLGHVMYIGSLDNNAAGVLARVDDALALIGERARSKIDMQLTGEGKCELHVREDK